MGWVTFFKGEAASAVGAVVAAVFAAVVAFAACRLLLALIKRVARLPGLVVSSNVLSLFAAWSVFNRLATYNFPEVVGTVIAGFAFVAGLYFVYNLLERVYLARRYRAGKVEDVPRIVRDVLRLAVVIVAIFLALKFYLGVQVTALIATSTVLSAVIGLAMQDTLANIFAGVALQAGKPFRVGDWVTVYNQTGTVVSISWRATRIKTRDNHLIEIPNANIAKAEIFNYSVPTPLQRRSVEVGVSYDIPPNEVKRVLLEAAAASAGVLTTPPADVLLVSFDDFAVRYRLRFWLNDFADVPRTEDRLMTNIWYHFKREGITIPYPIRDVKVKTVGADEERRAEDRRLARALEFFDGVDLFDALSRQEKEHLARVSAERIYGAGAVIVRQGEVGSEFFVVTAGRVRTTVADSRGGEVELGVFGPGYFFGEMSLLTGEPRGATVTALEDTRVVVITKGDFRDILTANPKVAAKLSAAVARRRSLVAQELARRGADFAAGEASPAASRDSILKRVKEFFNLK